MTRSNRLLSTILVLALVGLVLGGIGPSEPTYADGGVGPSDGLIAVTGLSREDNETLYLIDTRRQVLLVYETERGKGIKLVAVRSIRHDAEILEYNDLSAPGFRPTDLKKRLEEKPAGSPKGN